MQRQYNRGISSTAIVAIVAALVAVVVIVMAVLMFSNYGNPYGYGYNGYGGMMGGFGGWGWFLVMPIGLIVLVIVGYVIWRGVGWGSGCGSGRYGSYTEQDNALEILRQRYARGEISKEQFEQMKRDLVS